MYRKAPALVPPFRTALLAAALVAALAAPAAADDLHVAYRMLVQGDDAGGGAAAPPAPAPTLADVAGAPRAVTLPELLSLAIRQAPALQLAEIDIQIAEAQIEAARSLDDYQVAAALSAVTNVRSEEIEGSASIFRDFSTGTTVSLRAEGGWSQTDFVTDMFSGTLTEYTDTVAVSVVQHLLEGRNWSVNRAAEVRARIAHDAAALARHRDAIQVVRDVVSAYWDLALAQRDLAISQSSLALAQERLRRTQALIRGGGTAATEALAVEQVIATREEEVLAAELAVIERSVDLRRLVGLEIGPGELVLSVPTELGIPAGTFQLDSLIADAYQASPELALLANQEEGATLEVEVTENGVLPSLDLALTFGTVGIDDRAAGALENMARFENVVGIATLSFSHSIGNHGARGAAREARAERLKVKIDMTDARAQIAGTLAQAVVLAESAARRVEIAGRAIELAEANITAEQARFALGKATNFDVLERQEELKEAQLRQARAIVDWQKAATSIAAISGSILPDYGIALPE